MLEKITTISGRRYYAQEVLTSGIAHLPYNIANRLESLVEYLAHAIPYWRKEPWKRS
jgi:hypothetical protein